MLQYENEMRNIHKTHSILLVGRGSMIKQVSNNVVVSLLGCLMERSETGSSRLTNIRSVFNKESNLNYKSEKVEMTNHVQLTEMTGYVEWSVSCICL